MDETIVYLLRKDASCLNIRDKNGKSPIFYVRNPKIVLLFQEFNENIIRRDIDGKPVLQDFLKKNVESAKALMYSQIDTYGKDWNANDLLITFDLDVFKHKKSKKVVFYFHCFVLHRFYISRIKLYQMRCGC